MKYTKYAEVKAEKEKRFDAIIKASSMFFAFSDQQFEEGENNCPLEPGDKYVSTYAGGILPSSKVDQWNRNNDDLNFWFSKTIEENNLKEQHILYELDNHEAFYTYSIDDTKRVLPYTDDEIWAVFNKNKHLRED